MADRNRPGLTSRTRHNAVVTPTGRTTGWKRPKAKSRRPINEYAVGNRGTRVAPPASKPSEVTTSEVTEKE